jgi:hypothetical protein
MSSPGPLGWIEPANRTPAQANAHADAASQTVKQFGLAPPDLPKGTKLILTDLWTKPEIVTDVGRRMMRELQNTGSCVNVGGRNALAVTIASQRMASDSPIKAFEPFTWHNYAMSRHYFGDDGQGEGSMGSTFAKSLHEDGVTDWPKDSTDILPDYTINGDHINITSSEEMKWSSYRNPNVQKVLQVSKAHLLGNAAELRSPADIKAMVTNGYGVSFACNNYVGNGSVKGSGADAYVKGRWNGSGGHQQWVFGYWEHPTDGPLYAVGNNWADNTYPQDPAGLPLCCLWVAEQDVAAAFRLDGEVYGLSHQDWFPAQPAVLSFSSF